MAIVILLESGMSKIIPCLLFAGAALTGLIGMQFASSAQAGSGQGMTSAQSFDGVTLPANPVVIELFTSQGC